MAQAPQVQVRPAPHVRPTPVGPFSSDKKYSDPERWICIYPAYINSLKTRSEGRQLPKEKCIPNPHTLEIRDVLISSGFKPIIENKKYPRERSLEFEFYGRIRVQLKKDDGSLVNDKYPTRESIFEHISQAIPTLKSRAGQKPGQEAAEPEAARKKSKKK